MDLGLEGRRCLVTGASAGLGRGIAELLIREGAAVAICARRQSLLQSVADSLGSRCVPLPGNIVEPAEPARLVAEAERLLDGNVEVLVNCAGNSTPAPIYAPDELWDDAMALNFTAIRRLTDAVLPGMRKARSGRIINVTALMEPQTISASMAAKAATHLWAKGLSRALAAEGITINSIAPGRLESEQVMERIYVTEAERAEFAARYIPAGHFGKPEDLAGIVAFLASPWASYITGTIIPVDGGMKNAV